MAEVYLAHDDVLDRDVALKILNNSHSNDEEFVERFRREAQSAAALSHPNIVSIYDRGETGDGENGQESQETYYIAMEYLPGGSLKDRINSRGALPARTAAEVALQIAEALKAAHERDVVHRDIKPHNIMITETGDLKVTDFGIARAATSSTMTRTGSIMGTAHYISPEQAMGEAAGPQSDLYSLGIVLYEMLTGELPFEAETPIGIAMKQVNTSPAPPSELDHSIPEGLDAITYRLMSKDPEDRYPDESELIEDLENVVAGYSPGEATTMALPAVAPPSGGYGGGGGERTLVSDWGGGSGRRRRRALPLVMLLFLALLALAGWAAYTMSPQSTPTAQVPDLAGLTLQEARNQAGEDFSVSVSDRRDSQEPEDTVLEQNPARGSEREQGSDISVVLSGQRIAEVPDVVGDSRNEAESRLAEDSFGVEVKKKESSASEEGNVVSQSPSPGTEADYQSDVTITVGTGPAPVDTPDLSGMTVSEARSELSGADLELGDQNEAASDSVAEGDIIRQSPGASSEAEPGSAVDVTVSTGPEAVSVPSLYGSSKADARAILSDAGLELGDVSERESGELGEGLILSQSRASGQTAEPGTAIDVTVSTGPAPVNVPDVIGDQVIDAQRELGSKGFGYTTQGVNSDEPAGTVISTDPGNGTEVEPGTQIDISYSLGSSETASNPTPTQSAPDPTPTQSAPDPTPTQSTPTQSTPTQSTPTQSTPTSNTPDLVVNPQPGNGGGGDSGSDTGSVGSPSRGQESGDSGGAVRGSPGRSGGSAPDAPDIEKPNPPDIQAPEAPNIEAPDL
jgi:serine/threonine-protein kinase